MTHSGVSLIFSDHSDHHQPHCAAVAVQNTADSLGYVGFLNDVLLTKPSQNNEHSKHVKY